ncbi:MAG: hypothetical protein M3453_15365 [Pseudomonadota bacterium]|nr:hypothetical protein [Pseudomonadota bacterium]
MPSCFPQIQMSAICDKRACWYVDPHLPTPKRKIGSHGGRPSASEDRAVVK